MNMPWEIPDKWEWIDIKTIGDVVSGGTPSTKESSYWSGSISWISPADLTGYTNKTIFKGAKSITDAGLKHSSAKLMPSGSVHFSSRAPIGYVAISSQSLCTNQGFKSIVPAQGMFNEYIYYYLKAAKQIAEERATGTTFREISGTAFGKLPIPIAPTNEQHSIVTKIEELFSELDKGIESLKTAREQLKVYRQALLKHAFEGKLTEQWRLDNTDKLETADQLLERIKQEREARYQQQLEDWKAEVKQWEAEGKEGRKPVKPKKPTLMALLDSKELVDTNSLPEGWSWQYFGNICDFENGDRGKNYPNRSEYTESGIPWINTGHIEPDGSLSAERLHHISREKYETLRSGKIKPGDLVYCLRGATFGKTAYVEPYEEGAIASSLMIIRPHQPITAQYVYSYLLSPLGKSQLQRFDNGSAQPNLSANSVKQYHFPLCSIAEENEISRLIDEQLETIGRFEKELENSLVQSEALRQSILKKAFTGQLVPQDSNDEPASVLLDRIAKEKEDAATRAKQVKAAKKKPKTNRTTTRKAS